MSVNCHIYQNECIHVDHLNSVLNFAPNPMSKLSSSDSVADVNETQSLGKFINKILGGVVGGV